MATASSCVALGRYPRTTDLAPAAPEVGEEKRLRPEPIAMALTPFATALYPRAIEERAAYAEKPIAVPN